MQGFWKVSIWCTTWLQLVEEATGDNNTDSSMLDPAYVPVQLQPAVPAMLGLGAGTAVFDPRALAAEMARQQLAQPQPLLQPPLLLQQQQAVPFALMPQAPVSRQPIHFDALPPAQQATFIAMLQQQGLQLVQLQQPGAPQGGPPQPGAPHGGTG